MFGRTYDKNTGNFIGNHWVDDNLSYKKEVDLYRNVLRTPDYAPRAPMMVDIRPPEPMRMPAPYDIGLPNRGPDH